MKELIRLYSFQYKFGRGLRVLANFCIHLLDFSQPTKDVCDFVCAFVHFFQLLFSLFVILFVCFLLLLHFVLYLGTKTSHGELYHCVNINIRSIIVIYSFVKTKNGKNRGERERERTGESLVSSI